MGLTVFRIYIYLNFIVWTSPTIGLFCGLLNNNFGKVSLSLVIMTASSAYHNIFIYWLPILYLLLHCFTLETIKAQIEVFTWYFSTLVQQCFKDLIEVFSLFIFLFHFLKKNFFLFSFFFYFKGFFGISVLRISKILVVYSYLKVGWICL